MRRLLYLMTLLHVTICAGPRSNNIPGMDEEGCLCEWTSWLNNDDYDPFQGDDNSFTNLRRHHDVCERPQDIECRSKMNPNLPFFFIERHGLVCDVSNGLVCAPGQGNSLSYCEDYEIRVLCCDCPQTTTSPSTSADMTSSLQLFNVTTIGNATSNVTLSGVDPTHFLVPISIIIVAVIAFFVVICVVLCVVLSHKPRKTTGGEQVYMEGHSYLQRPVSFTDVDLPSASSSRSLSTSSSSSGSRHGYQLTRLDKGQLQFLQTDEPDVISSNRAADPLINQVSEERQWLPDETAISLEKHSGKQTKKALFYRTPVPPVPQAEKSFSCVEENQSSS